MIFFRKNPSPFEVINCTRKMFRKWSEFLNPLYLKSCPFPTRPIRILFISSKRPDEVAFSKDFSENFEYINLKGNAKIVESRKRSPEFPEQLYEKPLPLKKAKIKDLRALAKFCGNPEARDFYFNLEEETEVIFSAKLQMLF